MAEQQEPEELTVATDLVVTKYKMASEMVNGTSYWIVIEGLTLTKRRENG